MLNIVLMSMLRKLFSCGVWSCCLNSQLSTRISKQSLMVNKQNNKMILSHPKFIKFLLALIFDYWITLITKVGMWQPLRYIAYPSLRTRRSNRRRIPEHPPPSLADEITRAKPMSTYNALANQPNKETTFIWKVVGWLYGGVYQWTSLTTHLVGKFYLVNFNLYPTSIYLV